MSPPPPPPPHDAIRKIESVTDDALYNLFIIIPLKGNLGLVNYQYWLIEPCFDNHFGNLLTGEDRGAIKVDEQKLLLRVNRLPQSGLKAGRHKYV